jgi:protein-S-isoprenylcysteine O-methyltransferase Ste14
MMAPDLSQWIDGLWIAFLVIWAIGAARTKQTARTQSGASQLLQRGLAAAGAVLLFDSGLGVYWLGVRLLPYSEGFGYAGLALTFAGIAFAVWARFAIGRNWSGNVTIKQDHELIRSGPYALVRHPIYTGILLAIAGTALAVDEVRGVVAFVLVTIGLWLKMGTEESFMIQQFGDQYQRYRREVKALIPFVL